jgi:hypothetical protein
MTIALNIVFAIVVFSGVVGILAHSVKVARAAQPKLHVAPAKARPTTATSRSTARQHAYGPVTGVSA